MKSCGNIKDVFSSAIQGLADLPASLEMDSFTYGTRMSDGAIKNMKDKGWKFNIEKKEVMLAICSISGRGVTPLVRVLYDAARTSDGAVKGGKEWYSDLSDAIGVKCPQRRERLTTSLAKTYGM